MILENNLFLKSILASVNIRKHTFKEMLWEIIFKMQPKTFFWDFFSFKNFYNNTKIQLKGTIKKTKTKQLHKSIIKTAVVITHTYTHKINNNNDNNNNNKIIIIIIKAYQPPFPKKKHPYNTPDGGPHRNRPRNRSRQLLSQRPPP